jgi:hypothetical protein
MQSLIFFLTCLIYAEAVDGKIEINMLTPPANPKGKNSRFWIIHKKSENFRMTSQ